MWPNLQFPVELVRLTEKIFDGKLHFLCSVQFENLKLISLREKNVQIRENTDQKKLRVWTLFKQLLPIFVPRNVCKKCLHFLGY